MFNRIIKYVPAACLAFALVAPSISNAQGTMSQPSDDGIVKVRSAYPMAETITRLEKDVAAKGIKFFIEVDQYKLAADAGIKIRPSTLLIFGNPPLGTLFIAANPLARLFCAWQSERASLGCRLLSHTGQGRFANVGS